MQSQPSWYWYIYLPFLLLILLNPYCFRVTDCISDHPDPHQWQCFFQKTPFVCMDGVLIHSYIFSVMLDDFGSAHYFSTFMCILTNIYKIMYLEHLFARDCSNLLLWASHCSDTMNSGACASGSVTRYLGTETWGNMIWTSTFLGDLV